MQRKGLTPLDQLDKLPKHRKDWLEIFGNQWGARRFTPAETSMTDEERQALGRSLNFFDKSA